MDAIKSLEFGHIIAFLLPGLVSARALAYYVSSLRLALEATVRGGEGNLGPIAVLLVAGATAGLTLSVCRQQWLDPAHGWVYGVFKDWDKDGNGKRCRTSRPPWRVNYRVLSARKDLQALYENAVNQVYRYYQFIGNMSIAMFLLFAARAEQYGISEPVTIGAGVSAVILELTAYQQFRGWCRVHNQIVGSATATAPTGASQASSATTSGTSTAAAITATST